MAEALDTLLVQIRACRFCVDTPNGAPLAHQPRPVLQAASTARLAIFSRAPGARVIAGLPHIRTAILVGSCTQRWHLGKSAASLTGTAERWREFAPRYFPTPHPSWRNNGWLKKHSWFEAELLPALRREVAAALDYSGGRDQGITLAAIFC